MLRGACPEQDRRIQFVGTSGTIGRIGTVGTLSVSRTFAQLRKSATIAGIFRSRDSLTASLARRSSVCCLFSRWSGGRWPFTHGVRYHGLGDPFYEFAGHKLEHEARVELGV